MQSHERAADMPFSGFPGLRRSKGENGNGLDSSRDVMCPSRSMFFAVLINAMQSTASVGATLAEAN